MELLVANDNSFNEAITIKDNVGHFKNVRIVDTSLDINDIFVLKFVRIRV